MLKQGTILVPIRSFIEWAIKHPEAWSEEMYAQLSALVESHRKSYAMAVKAGVQIALESDLAISSHKMHWTHGMNGAEFRCAIDPGMTPLQAIEAGTANAPGTPGFTSSQIRATESGL